MPINPITSTRLKMGVILGHSNADGWAPSDNVVASPGQHLTTGSLDPVASPEDAYYKNIYMLTSAQPFPGANATPVASSVSDVAWLEMTIANTTSPSQPHPHPSPFDFPNVAGACYPRWAYNAYQYENFAYDGGGSPTGPWLDNNEDASGVRTGIEVPLGWSLRNYYQEQVAFCKVAYSSSFFLPIETGSGMDFVDPPLFGPGVRPSDWTPSTTRPIRSASNANAGFYAHWTPSDAFDFSPATDRFYKMWYDKMVAGAAALPSGSKMDVRFVLAWFGDNDSVARSQDVLEGMWKSAVLEFVRKIRSDIATNDWSSLSEKQIPIIWPKVHPGYPNNLDTSYDSVAFMNGVLDDIAKEDEYFFAPATAGWTVLGLDGLDGFYSNILNTANHYGPEGYRMAADDVMDILVGLETDPFDALDLDDALTLQQVRDRVRTYYSKSRANTDVSDEIVDQHINASMYHCLNHCGDNAWWLRRRKRLTITAGSNTVMTLPKYVHRLMMIEENQDPSYPINFEQIGHGEGGKLQIRVSERTSGSYMCQFITMPKEVTKADQKVPAPRNITEWIIVEACRRLAAASNNVPLMGHFAGESQQLMSDALRSMGQVQRSKKDVMRTQRRRPNLGYGRGRRLWASDT